MLLLAAAVLGYGLGSVPFGFVLSRLAGLGDIRALGSGSIGATNVLRTGRKDVAAATVLLDGGKGAVAALVMARFGDAGQAGAVLALVAGVAAVLGHCTSPWMGFRGGKGIATGFGVVLAWAWPVGVACAAIWLVVAVAGRRSSLAGLAAATAAPLLMLAFEPWPMAVATALSSVLIIARHQANIRRLLAGTEPKIGAR